MRHQVFPTDTPTGEGPSQHLEVRHRAHARVEVHIRGGRTTGFGRFPCRRFNATEPAQPPGVKQGGRQITRAVRLTPK